MSVILAIILSYLYVDLLGYLIHRLAHTHKMTGFYESHQTHHQLYTAKDFLSEFYRSAGIDSFVLYYIPFAMVTILFGYLFLSFTSLIILMSVMAIFGFGTDLIHTQIHLIGSGLDKFKWFRNLRNDHVVHHKSQNKNFGIISLLFDRIFRSYVKGMRPTWTKKRG